MEPGLNPAWYWDLGQGMDFTQLYRRLGLHQRLSLGQNLLILLHLGPDDQLVLERAGQRGINVIFESLSAGSGGPGDWSAVCQAVTCNMVCLVYFLVCSGALLYPSPTYTATQSYTKSF